VTLLQTVVKEEKWQYFELRPESGDEWEESVLEKSNSFHFHVLDLRPAVDDLFRAAHKTAIQQAIRRAERERLEYAEGRSEALLKNFYCLLLATRRRHMLPPQPIEWFRHLIRFLGDRLKIRVASKDGRPVASIVTLSYGDTVTYKYGCSDAASHNLGGTPFLLWRTIREAKEAGATRLDLGRSDSNNAGLITFKERWGALSSTLTYLRHSTSRRRANERYGTRFAKQAFAYMPGGLLTVAGRVLYRHIG